MLLNILLQQYILKNNWLTNKIMQGISMWVTLVIKSKLEIQPEFAALIEGLLKFK